MADSKRTENDVLRKILRALKTNFIYIICIVVVFVAIGVGYSFIKKPVYTAMEKTVYKAKISENKDSPYDYTATKSYLNTMPDFCVSGYVVTRANAYYEEFIATRQEYVDVTEFVQKKQAELAITVSYDELKENKEEFIGKEIVFNAVVNVGSGTALNKQDEKFIGVFEGFEMVQDKNGAGIIVPDVEVETIKFYNEKTDERVRMRARHYYNGTLIDFLQLREIEPTGAYKYLDNYAFFGDINAKYNIVKAVSDKNYITEKNIVIEASSEKDDDISFAINVGYKDNKPQSAYEKVKILVLAIDAEAKICVPYKTTGEGIEKYVANYKYFGVKVDLSDWGAIGCYSSVSKPKIIIIFTLIGILCAAIFVYIKSVINRTVRDKRELEELTGANCLALIENVTEQKREGENGR